MDKKTAQGGRNEDETRFSAIMRQKIYQLTDYDIEPNDPIYPLLACLQLLARGCVNILRDNDRKEWEKIEAKIEKTLREYYGPPKPARMRIILIGGICAAGGIVVGVGLGFFFRMATL